MQRIFMIILMLVLVGCGSTTAPTVTPTTLVIIDVEPLPSLVGTQWVVTSINGQPVKGPKPLPFVFEQDGRVSGHGGCNGYSGDVQIEEDQITIGSLMSTMMACAENDLQNQETQLVQALEIVQSYRATDTTLQFLDAQGVVVVELEKQS